MIPYADTSFFGAIFRFQNKGFSPSAEDWWNANGHVQIVYSRLNELELNANWHRLSLASRKMRKKMYRSRAAFEDAVSRRLIIKKDVREVDKICDAAEEIMRNHSSLLPFGSLDLLHLAVAKILKADTLLSFDDEQRDLASAAGMKVFPSRPFQTSL